MFRNLLNPLSPACCEFKIMDRLKESERGVKLRWAQERLKTVNKIIGILRE